MRRPLAGRPARRRAPRSAPTDRAVGDDARAGRLGRRAARDLGAVRGAASASLLLKERFRLQRAVGTGAIVAGVMALRLADRLHGASTHRHRSLTSRATMSMPAQARIVIVGGGIAGCSTAYHLAGSARRTCWCSSRASSPAARPGTPPAWSARCGRTATMTRMSKYGIELYATLEAETGLATGWKQCGSVNVAAHARAHEGPAQAARAGAQLRRRVRGDQRRARPASCSRCCAPTTSQARSGSRATARPIPPT